MQVINYTGKTEFLSSIALQWETEANPEKFGIKCSLDKFLASLQELASNPQSALLLLCDDSGNVHGFMGCVLFDSPLDGQLIANEHFWFVTPKHRNGTAAMRLIKAAKAWAKANGASHLIMNASMLASDSHDRVCKLYERTMKHFETTYIQCLD